jgi:retron-type reverse transcriptase
MKGRMQKKSIDTCQQKNRTESDGYVEGQTFIWITENNLTDKYQLGNGLLEFILSPNNLNQAYHQVKRNKGAGGIDKMEVESLKDYLVRHKDELIKSILEGKYRPSPVRRVEIPKETGKTRQLGIPTVVDRVIQQSISQVLSQRETIFGHELWISTKTRCSSSIKNLPKEYYRRICLVGRYGFRKIL